MEQSIKASYVQVERSKQLNETRLRVLQAREDAVQVGRHPKQRGVDVVRQ